jgi:hypothetical protein
MMEKLETAIEGILSNGVDIIKFSGPDAGFELARSINRQ